MASYSGDIQLGANIDIFFSTVSQGVPIALAGSPVISAYAGNGTTEITAGITLDVSFDGVVGLNHVRVTATSGNGYATGTDVTLVITTGTVNSLSAVGYVVGSFSIENRAVNWNKVSAPTTTVGLTGTTISSSQIVASVTAGVTLAASAVTAIWAALTSALTTVGSIGKLLVDNINATIASRTSPSDTQVTDVTQTATSEPGQGAPPVSATPSTKIAYLYKFMRNKITQSTSEFDVYNDAGNVVDHKASVSDSGALFTRDEISSGP